MTSPSSRLVRLPNRGWFRLPDTGVIMRHIAIAGSVTAVLFCALVSGASSQVQDQQAAIEPALVAQGAWSAMTTYHKDDLVTARGSTWRALTTSKNRVPGSTS